MSPMVCAWDESQSSAAAAVVTGSLVSWDIWTPIAVLLGVAARLAVDWLRTRVRESRSEGD